MMILTVYIKVIDNIISLIIRIRTVSNIFPVMCMLDTAYGAMYFT